MTTRVPTRVLVTGFEPFGESDDNPSMQVVEALRSDPPPGCDLVTGLLPVTWAGASPALTALLEGARPDLVLLLGQSGKRPSVTVERFALNFGQGRIPDNAGVERPPGPLIDRAPLALASTIGVERAVEAISRAGVQARASHDAGAFLCNAVLFHTLYHARPGQRAGFIHLPMMPGQSGAGETEPTMEEGQSQAAVRAVLDALV